VTAGEAQAQIKLDERQHVEKPLLDQLAGLGWEVLDLNIKEPTRLLVTVSLSQRS
jgi:type I restriction enzyme, R subunit